MTRDERVLQALERLRCDDYVDIAMGKGRVRGEFYLKFPPKASNNWMYKYMIADGLTYKWMPYRFGFFLIEGKFAKLVRLAVVFK